MSNETLSLNRVSVKLGLVQMKFSFDPFLTASNTG